MCSDNNKEYRYNSTVLVFSFSMLEVEHLDFFGGFPRAALHSALWSLSLWLLAGTPSSPSWSFSSVDARRRLHSVSPACKLLLPELRQAVLLSIKWRNPHAETENLISASFYEERRHPPACPSTYLQLIPLEEKHDNPNCVPLWFGTNQPNRCHFLSKGCAETDCISS